MELLVWGFLVCCTLLPSAAAQRLRNVNGSLVLIVPQNQSLQMAFEDADGNLVPVPGGQGGGGGSGSTYFLPLATLTDLSSMRAQIISDVQSMMSAQLGQLNATLQAQVATKVNVQGFDASVQAIVGQMVGVGASNPLATQLGSKLDISASSSTIVNVVVGMVAPGAPSNALATQLGSKVNMSSLDTLVQTTVNAMVTPGTTAITSSSNLLFPLINSKVNTSSLDGLVQTTVNAMVTPGNPAMTSSSNVLFPLINSKVNSSSFDGLVQATVNAMTLQATPTAGFPMPGMPNALFTQLSAKVNSSSLDSLVQTTVNNMVQPNAANSLNTLLNFKVDARNLSVIDSQTRSVVQGMVALGANNDLSNQLAGKLNISAACPYCTNPLVIQQLNSSIITTQQTAASFYVDVRNLSTIDSRIATYVQSAAQCRTTPFLLNGNVSSCNNGTSLCISCNPGYVLSAPGSFACRFGSWSNSPICCPNASAPISSFHGSATFTSSGTFTLPAIYSTQCPASVTVLAIGGGGAGGTEWGSGGGSGFLTTGVFSVTASQTVTIGQGGASPGSGGSDGGSGGATSFGSIATANGGLGGRGRRGGGNPVPSHCSSVANTVTGWSASAGACRNTAGNGGSNGGDSTVCCTSKGSNVTLPVLRLGTVSAGAGGVGGTSPGDGGGGGGGGGIIVNGQSITAGSGGGAPCAGFSYGGAGGQGYGAGGGGGSSCSGVGAAGAPGILYVEW